MKKMISMTLAVAMTMSLLAGCGSNSASTESASGGDTFKIGGIGPVTGGAAIYGQAVKNGAELAIKE